MQSLLDQTFLTYTGRTIDPFNLSGSDIDIADIAHALSNICRFTGHSKSFYSVAEHSFLVSLKVDSTLALPALLHDAAEAYFTDLNTPVKYAMGMEPYRIAEERAQQQIFWRFGVECKDYAPIKAADEDVYRLERSALFPPFTTKSLIEAWCPYDAEMRFLQRFNYVFKKHHTNEV